MDNKEAQAGPQSQQARRRAMMKALQKRRQAARQKQRQAARGGQQPNAQKQRPQQQARQPNPKKNIALIAKFLNSEQGKNMVGKIAIDQLSQLKKSVQEQKEEMESISNSKAKLRLLAEEIINNKKSDVDTESQKEAKKQDITLNPDIIDMALARMGEPGSVMDRSVLQQLAQKGEKSASKNNEEEKEAQYRGLQQQDGGFEMGDAALGAGAGAGAGYLGPKLFGSSPGSNNLASQVADVNQTGAPIESVSEGSNLFEYKPGGPQFKAQNITPEGQIQMAPMDETQNVRFLDPENTSELQDWRHLIKEDGDVVQRQAIEDFKAPQAAGGQALDLTPQAKNRGITGSAGDEIMAALRRAGTRGDRAGKRLGSRIVRDMLRSFT